MRSSKKSSRYVNKHTLYQVDNWKVQKLTNIGGDACGLKIIVKYQRIVLLKVNKI